MVGLEVMVSAVLTDTSATVAELLPEVAEPLYPTGGRLVPDALVEAEISPADELPPVVEAAPLSPLVAAPAALLVEVEAESVPPPIRLMVTTPLLTPICALLEPALEAEDELLADSSNSALATLPASIIPAIAGIMKSFNINSPPLTRIYEYILIKVVCHLRGERLERYI